MSVGKKLVNRCISLFSFEKFKEYLEREISSSEFDKLVKNLVNEINKLNGEKRKKGNKEEVMIQDFINFKSKLNKESFKFATDYLAKELVKNQEIVDVFESVDNIANWRATLETNDCFMSLLKTKQKNNDLNELLKIENAYDKFLSLYILDKGLFKKLYYICINKIKNDSLWSTRANIKINQEINDNIIRDRIEKLKATISNLAREEGKNGFCHIEYFHFDNDIWFVADLENEPFRSEIWKDGDKTTDTITFNKSIIFILNQEQKTLRTLMNCGDRRKVEYENAFSLAILEEEINGYPSKNTAYNIRKSFLDILRDRKLNYNIKNKNILNVFMTKIKLHNENGTTTIEIDEREKFNSDIYKRFNDEYYLTEKLDNGKMKGELCEVRQIFLTVNWKRDFDKIAPIRFSIDFKGRVRLKNDKIGIEILKMLKDNGI